MGMETRYFVLQLPGDNEQPIPYTFDYCRAPDDIVIFIGTNDYLDDVQNRENGNVQTFAEHYLAFVKRLREKFPHAKVILRNLCRINAVATKALLRLLN